VGWGISQSLEINGEEKQCCLGQKEENFFLKSFSGEEKKGKKRIHIVGVKPLRSSVKCWSRREDGAIIALRTHIYA